MIGSRTRPFRRALLELRERLLDGRLPPGTRILAAEFASELKLSQTPVREALSRLSGERLLEDRRGEGVYVRRLSRSDIADLYRLNLAYLLIGLEPGRPLRGPVVVPRPDETEVDPVVTAEQIFLGWMLQAASPALLAAFNTAQLQIGAVRRLEAQVIPELAQEARALAIASAAADAAPDRSDWLQHLRLFHMRRLRLVGQLSSLYENLGSHEYNGI